MNQADNTAEQAVPRYSWYALAILFLIYLTNFVDRQILSVLANDIKADLQIDDAQLGFLYGTAFAIFYALFGIPLGKLADSMSRVKLLGLGLALWSIMTMLTGLAKNLGQLTIARVGVGIGEASANPCAYSLIADWFPRGARATAISIYSAGLFVGSGVSLVIGGAIVEGWNAAFPIEAPLGLAGWQAAFLIVGAPGLLLALWALSLREPERAQTQGEKLPSAARVFVEQIVKIVPPFTLVTAFKRGRGALACNLLGAIALGLLAWGMARLFGNAQQFVLVAIGYYAVFSWASALRQDDQATFAMTWGSRAFMSIVVLYAAISFYGYAVTYWAAPYAERSFELSKTELGLVIGAPNALGGFLGVVAGGLSADWLARHHACGRLLATSAALLLPIPIVVIGYRSETLEVFLFCNFLVQMATSSALGASVAASQALVQPQMRGTAAAIFLLGPTLIGLAFGPFTAGYVSEESGSLAIGVMICLLAAIPGCIALLVALRSYGAAIRAAELRV